MCADESSTVKKGQNKSKKTKCHTLFGPNIICLNKLSFATIIVILVRIPALTLPRRSMHWSSWPGMESAAEVASWVLTLIGD